MMVYRHDDFFYFDKVYCDSGCQLINPFYATGLFQCPLKTSETQRFSDVFRGYIKMPVAGNELNTSYYGLRSVLVPNALLTLTLNLIFSVYMLTLTN